MSQSPPAEDEREPPEASPPLLAYAGALVVYIGLGYVLRSVVLNWVVGPLFLLVALYLLPRLVRSPAAKQAG